MIEGARATGPAAKRESPCLVDRPLLWSGRFLFIIVVREKFHTPGGKAQLLALVGQQCLFVIQLCFSHEPAPGSENSLSADAIAVLKRWQVQLNDGKNFKLQSSFA
jgi:hypothetical protein